jgi:3D-(3,5/4)-trihydroxycyclohexane-1,2-dione acylhydrolase (decyclizing)
LRRTTVVCIETDPARTIEEGGWWWEVAVPEVSARPEVRDARTRYDEDRRKQRP